MAPTGYIVCQICESYHDSFEELNAHYERDHPTGSGAEKNFQCKLCDKSFTLRNSMYRHQRKAHGRVLYESDNLPKSIQPNEEGRFPCEFCDKSFTHKGHVYGHQRKVHVRESACKRATKPKYQGNFPCKVCGKKFSSASNRNTHLRSMHSVSQK